MLLRTVAEFKGKDVTKLIETVRLVGRKLMAAQPREIAVGNIVRRVLGLIREIAEETSTGTTQDLRESEVTIIEKHDADRRPLLNSTISSFSPLKRGVVQPAEIYVSSPRQSPSLPGARMDYGSLESTESQILKHRENSLTTSQSSANLTSMPMPTPASLFGLLSYPDLDSFPWTSPTHSIDRPDYSTASKSFGSMSQSIDQKHDLKADVLEGIREILDELDQADEQIAAYSLDHIHANEVILTHAASTTVQKFLLAAAKKREFTVVHVEGYPNDHLETYDVITTGRKAVGDPNVDDNDRFRPLTAAGISVILVPDSAVFAIMSRVNKVILATHSVLANGGLVAAAGARMIAEAAKLHRTPVVVLSSVYKLSPVYPFDIEDLIEYGDSSQVIRSSDESFDDKIDVINPQYDYVPADLVDLYITNLSVFRSMYFRRSYC